MEELKERLQINKNMLDEELVAQPAMHQKTSEEYAYAVSRRDELKNDLKRLHAELYMEYSEQMKASKQRVTEASLSNKIELTEEYQQLQQALILENKNVDILSGMKEAFSQRAYILKDLCSIYLAGYFSENNSVRSSSTQEMLDIEAEKTKQEIKEKRKTLRYKLSETRGKRTQKEND